MNAVLWIKVCLGICFIQPVATIPQSVCMSQQGQSIAAQTAVELGLRLEDWTCVPERRV